MKPFYRILYVLSSIVFKTIFRFKATGRENFTSGPAIIASNHLSYLDPIAIGLSVNRQVHFLAKADLLNVPVLKCIIKHCDAIPINRDKADRVAILRAIKVLQNGGIVGIFPQGTRTEELDQFKRGVGLISQKSGAPVYPIRLINTDKVLVGGFFPVRFPKISSVIGGAIYPSKVKDKNEQVEISVKVMEAISTMA